MLSKYFKEIENKVRVAYAIAEEARARGFDPVSKVEIPLATSLAERVTGLISTKYAQIKDGKIEKRIRELEEKYGLLDPMVAFKMAEEIAAENFCRFKDKLEAIDAGIRVGIAYLTLAVVSSPLEGFTHLKLKKTEKGEDYFAVYYSGPIRSAGGTAAATSVILVDYLREKFGYARYDPTEKEAKRTVTELYDYHERITNLQYLPTEKEIEIIASNIPVQVDGDPSEDKEVSNYKDLPRIETNMLRSGMCLVIGEGVAQKAAKLLKIVKGLKEKGLVLSHWDWLSDLAKLKKVAEVKPEPSSVYIKDLVAGRPVLAHPSRAGGFRLRYGRSRVSGYSAVAIHPATMALLDSFIAIGTQIRTERPGKSAAVTACDSIEGPIVKLKNGSVVKIEKLEDALKCRKEVSEIIYLGDILVSYGDFLNRNHPLMPAGYNEEWWLLDFLQKTGESINAHEVSFEKAMELSVKNQIPLHPKYTFYWSQINHDSFFALLKWLSKAALSSDGRLILHLDSSVKKVKRAMETLGIPHSVDGEKVEIGKEDAKALFANIGMNSPGEIENLTKEPENREGVLAFLNSYLKFPLMDKGGSFIGARMGRPEKAKLRKLIGSPHVLFPVGKEGGRLRSFQEAMENGKIKADFPIYFCDKCQAETIYYVCENCGEKTKQIMHCPSCERLVHEVCPQHGGIAAGTIKPFMEKRIDSKHYIEAALKHLNFGKEEMPPLVKGVRGTSSSRHIPEHLSKGILRAKYHLHVNKDGTIRFDATELPMTHFKPKEIGTSVEKLIELGYSQDAYGKKLTDEDQILELMPQDMILPSSPETPDEKADEVFISIAKFVDNLLVRLYGKKPFYNASSREDMIGHLIVCIAPHNAAGVIGRIIGFSKMQAILASPYMHGAVRRDCVYPSTKIFFYNEDTRDIFYNNIGNYVEKLIEKGAKTKKIDSFGTLAVENKFNYYAMGIDPYTHKLKKKKIKYFIKGPKTKEWVKITTATNREYIMTPTHKFMHINNGKFEFKEARNAFVGDKIPVLRKFNFEFSRKEVNLIRLFNQKLPEKEKREILVIDNGKEKNLLEVCKECKKSYKKYKNAKLRWKFSKHKIPVILKIGENLMRILGYYAAEGHSRTNKWVSQISFRICNKNIQDDAIKSIKKVFGIKANLGENNSKITICGKLIYYIFKSLGTGEGAYSKRVPAFIFGLNKGLTAEYLSAYFEGDGSIIKRNAVFYSVSRNLLDDVALLLTKFNITGRYFRTDLRLPGKKVLRRYKELGKEPKRHVLNHLVLGVNDSFKLSRILNIVNKEKALKVRLLGPTKKEFLIYNKKHVLLTGKGDYIEDYINKVDIIKKEKNSYCVEIEWDKKEDRNILWGEQIINTRCDGDEMAVMLLLDTLMNFSREYLSAHRGATQDTPLILNARIRAGEVDDMVFNVDVARTLPMELYKSAEQFKPPYTVKVEQILNRLKGTDNDVFTNLWYSHETSDINGGVLCSSYKTLATMGEKVQHQMGLAEKIRAVDASDVARLVIERHFIRDIRGNLRKFSMQQFRCVNCNEKYRRPPLTGKCLACGGRIIFTISEGSIMKYLEPALQLANKYGVSDYIKQNLEMTQRYIESIFGKETEKQQKMDKWF